MIDDGVGAPDERKGHRRRDSAVAFDDIAVIPNRVITSSVWLAGWRRGHRTRLQQKQLPCGVETEFHILGFPKKPFHRHTKFGHLSDFVIAKRCLFATFDWQADLFDGSTLGIRHQLLGFLGNRCGDGQRRF